MGLKTMSLLASATVAASGGSALAFAEDGVSIPNGLHLIVPSDTDFTTRRQVTVKYRPSTYDTKTGKFTKDKKTLSLVKPYVNTDGSIVFSVIRVERELYPLESAANATEMLKLAAQMCVDTDLDSFWATGSLS